MCSSYISRTKLNRSPRYISTSAGRQARDFDDSDVLLTVRRYGRGAAGVRKSSKLGKSKMPKLRKPFSRCSFLLLLLALRGNLLAAEGAQRVYTAVRAAVRGFLFFVLFAPGALRVKQGHPARAPGYRNGGRAMRPFPFTSRTPRFLPFVGYSSPKPEYASWRRGVRICFAFAFARPGWFATFAGLTSRARWSRAICACFGRRALCCTIERKLPLTSSRSYP